MMLQYLESRINKHVHGTAISFVILGVVMLQFFMLMYTFLRTNAREGFTPMTKVSFAKTYL